MEGSIEMSLADSELRYRRLFESARDGILILDSMTGMIEDVNPYLINMLGYPREEFVKKKIWEVGAFRDIDASKEAFEALQKNEYIRYDDLPLKTKDGRLVQVEFVSNVYRVGAEKVIQCNIRNITERKLAEKALKISEGRFRAIFEQAPLGIAVVSSTTGKFYEVNSRFAEIAGKSLAEIKNLDWMQIIHVDDLQANLENLALMNAGEIKGYKLEKRYVNSDGTEVWINMTIVSLNVEDKTNPRHLCMIENITDQKQAEEALRTSELKFRSYTEFAPLGVFIVDQSGHYVEVNAAAAKMLGCTEEDLLQLSIPDVLAPYSLEAGLQQFQKVVRDGFATSEFLFRRKDGTQFWSTVFAVRLSENRFMSYCQDISERKLAEQALELAYSQLSNLYNNLPEAVFSIDVVQNKMLQASPAHEIVFGHSVDEFFRNPHLLFELVIPDDRAIIDAGYPTLLAGETLEKQFRIIRPDGKIAWIETTIKPGYSVNGQLVRLDGIASDITARKQAEARIHRQLDHLTALSAIDRVIAANFDLKLNLSEILAHVIIELGIDAADILKFNPNSQMLEFGAERGFLTRTIKKAQVHLGESLAGRVALERQLVQIPDLAKEPNNELLTSLLADDHFVCYYGVPLIAKGQVKGVLEVYNRTPIQPDDEWLEFLNTLAGQSAIALDNAMLFDNLQRSNSELAMAYDATIEGWSRALDLRDKETEGHTQRVTTMAMELARSFGLDDAELVQVRWGALLHDIGKMGVPDGILLKPGPLTDEEWVAMKKHPALAYNMLSPIRYLRLALEIPYCHHEKWDGSGYPRGLVGVEIPLPARIFAVVDVWDALCSDRPYRKAWPEEKVREYIRMASGTEFDPQVVDTFLCMTQPV